MKTSLESTEHVVGFGNMVEMVSKNTFQKFDGTCEADETEDATSLGDFSALSNGMIMATLLICGK